MRANDDVLAATTNPFLGGIRFAATRSGRHQIGVILSRLNFVQMAIMSIVAALLWFQVGAQRAA